MRDCTLIGNRGERVANQIDVEKLRADFIEKSQKIFGTATFNYKNVHYVNGKTKVELICNRHGPFDIIPEYHILLKYGCPNCFSKSGNIFSPTEQFCCGREFKTFHAISIHRAHMKCAGYAKYGEWLKEIYEKKGLLVKDIARIINIDAKTISRDLKIYGIKVKRANNSVVLKGRPAWNKGRSKYQTTFTGNDVKRTEFFRVLGSHIRRSSKYALWRKNIFERDNFTCVLSNNRNGQIEAHHKVHMNSILEELVQFEKYGTDFNSALKICLESNSLLWDINNGITLSKEIHRKLHKREVNEMKAIITGAYGQDATYLSEFLLEKGFEVISIGRRHSSASHTNVVQTLLNNPKYTLVYGDITDPSFISFEIQKHKPQYYFNLAAQSHVGISFTEPILTMETNARAVLIALEAIRHSSPDTKFYQAGTSEQWGNSPCPVEGFDENSPFSPMSPYAVAKTAAYHAVKNYREAYGLYACCGQLLNHESTRRPIDFITRKITYGLAAIKTGAQNKIVLGNLDAVRDWGWAPDYVEAMWLMMQQENPDDYVVGTGEVASVREALQYVCDLAELNINDVYQQNEKFMRPSDVPFLKGNAAKIRSLGWRPTKNWKDVLKEMYEHDLKLLRG